jgi:hypothetical protein
MKKYLLIVLLVGVWSCENEDKEELKLIFSSINDGDTLTYIPSGILLKFSDNISRNLFDAESINIMGVKGITIPGTNDSGSIALEIDSNFYKIENSNFIKVNNEPQTFIYDSTNATCLLLKFNNVFYPDGTGEGLSIKEGENTLIIGNEYFSESINFSVGIAVINPYLPVDPLYDIETVPNPYQEYSSFDESLGSREIRFTNLPLNCIINIYEIENSYQVNRIIHNSQLSGNAWWDARAFDNSIIPSGFYEYRFGTDTTNTGHLNELVVGYFAFIIGAD